MPKKTASANQGFPPTAFCEMLWKTKTTGRAKSHFTHSAPGASAACDEEVPWRFVTRALQPGINSLTSMDSKPSNTQWGFQPKISQSLLKAFQGLPQTTIQSTIQSTLLPKNPRPVEKERRRASLTSRVSNQPTSQSAWSGRENPKNWQHSLPKDAGLTDWGGRKLRSPCHQSFMAWPSAVCQQSCIQYSPVRSQLTTHPLVLVHHRLFYLQKRPAVGCILQMQACTE